MKIIIDAMGGDNAPDAVVQGCADSARRSDVSLVLVGNKSRIESCLRAANAPLRLCEIVHTDDVIGMEDDPMSILRAHRHIFRIRRLKEHSIYPPRRYHHQKTNYSARSDR